MRQVALLAVGCLVCVWACSGSSDDDASESAAGGGEATVGKSGVSVIPNHVPSTGMGGVTDQSGGPAACGAPSVGGQAPTEDPFDGVVACGAGPGGAPSVGGQRATDEVPGCGSGPGGAPSISIGGEPATGEPVPVPGGNASDIWPDD